MGGPALQGPHALREPGIRQGRRRTEASPSRRAHSLADHTFNNPILRTHYPKGLAQGRCPPPRSSHPTDVPPGEGTGREPGSHLEDLIGAEARKHEGVPLHVQDGAGHQQVQVGAGQPCPQHLAVPEAGARWGGALTGKASTPGPTWVSPMPCPSPTNLPTRPPVYLPQLFPSTQLAHLPQPEDIREGEFPLEPDEQPPEAEAERTRVLGVWSGGQWREGQCSLSTPIPL